MRRLLRIVILSVICTAIVLAVVKASWILDAKNKSKVLINQWQTPHFNIYTEMNQSEADYYLRFLESFYTYFEENYFEIHGRRPLEVYLFKDEDSYRPYVQALYKDYTPFGFYTGLRDNRIVVNGDSGLGTLTHELTHYFIDIGFEKDPPKWVDEGIATFFEKFIGHFDENGKLDISFGYFSNWRFPTTKQMIDTVELPNLLVSSDPEQCCLRSFSLFLHKKGLFSQCVQQWRKATQPDDWVAIMEKAYSAPLEQIELEWKNWVQSQPVDGDVKLVPSAFVLEEQQWKSWQTANQEKVYWSEREGIYRARAK